MRNDAEHLVEAYSDLIVRLGWQHLGSREDALDICQDVLLKLMMHQGAFESEEHEKAWVVRVTINACKDALGQAARARQAPLEDAPEPSYSFPDTLEESDVLAAVRRLPESQREAIYLHYYEGYAIGDIVRLTHRSYAAIAQDLSRGRKKLRGLLEG